MTRPAVASVDQPGAPPRSELPADTPALSVWLDVFVRLLRMPPSERLDVRRELETHLNERIRDLTIDGLNPDCAITTAIGELGETAELAGHFNHARLYPRRRLLMNGTLALAAASIVGLGIYTAVPGSSLDVHQFGERAAVETAAEIRIDLNAEEISLADCLGQIAGQVDEKVFVHLRSIEEEGVSTEELISLKLASLPLERTLNLVGTVIGLELSYAFDGELLEIGPTDFIHARTVELVSYDIAGAVELMQGDYAMEYDEATSHITDALFMFVAPAYWEENGGELARMRIVGSRLFVEAPRFMQEKAAWVLHELTSGTDVDE